jgi:hypothetical protein
MIEPLAIGLAALAPFGEHRLAVRSPPVPAYIRALPPALRAPAGNRCAMWRETCLGVASAHATNSGGAMPVVSPAWSAASTALFVWESLEQPGDYALCTDQQHPDFQNPHWRFRGELATVPELDGFPRPSIANGWPTRVHIDRPSSGDDRTGA